MSGVSAFGLTPRPALRPLALTLAMIAQVMVTVVAAVVEARTDQSAGAHAEQAGTQLHRAHLEALCTACTAKTLLGPAPHGASTRPAARGHTEPPAATVGIRATRARLDAAAPRAPPARI